jgi:PAS domain-containing protein
LRSNQSKAIEKSILAALGQVSGASHVSIYSNHRDEQGRWFASEVVKWTTLGGKEKNFYPINQDIDYEKMVPTWFDQMMRGGVITGKAADLSPEEQGLLKPFNILSILVLPIFIGGDFFGFMRLDHCVEKHLWDASEITLLHVAAASISMAIERMQAENRLRESQSSLILMLDQLPAILWTTDPDLNITSIRGSTLAGFKIQTPATIQNLFPGQMQGENPIRMHNQALSGAPVSFEFTFQDRYLQVYLEPFYDASGMIIGTLGLGLDVSE